MIYGLWKKWHECRHLLIKELEICVSHNEDDILIGLATGQLRLWTGRKSAIVTRIKEEPQVKIVECLITGGELKEIQKMALKIEGWAKTQGCALAMHYGRHGWTKAMDDYEDYGSVIVKEL